MADEYKLAVLDFETDPFLYGREPKPFCVGLYMEDDYIEYWGADCVDKIYQFLCRYETPLRIYAHNGGKFDFLYFVKEQMLESDLFIINGRITRAKIDKHELRDSYAILPIPLAAYSKDNIDYSWFEESEREAHKKQILHYLYKDCVYLYQLVSSFVERFGYKLTIGSTAIKILREMHPFENQGKRNDDLIRPYYFGGRVQCFETGIVKTAIKVYDVNSMYPSVMREAWHPCGGNYEHFHGLDLNENGELRRRSGWPFFIHFTGKNYGALPSRIMEGPQRGGLTFTKETGEFFTTSHELQIALKHNLIEIHKVHSILKPFERINFVEYVDRFINEKIEAKKIGDKAGEIFAKLLANSAYGKTAQNPSSYYDHRICYTFEHKVKTQEENDEIEKQNESREPDKQLPLWELAEFYGGIEIWKKQSLKPVYYDIAIGASITSAARSVLLDAIVSATRPLYCDTDSIICEALTGVDLDPYKLGAWDLEAEGDAIAIAGKKMYAVMRGDTCVKKATKGANLESGQIFSLCRGNKIHDFREAPTFSRVGEARFIHRKIRATY